MKDGECGGGDSRNVDWGLPLSLWGILAGGAIAILTAYKPGWAWWTVSVLWLALTATSLLAMLDP